VHGIVHYGNELQSPELFLQLKLKQKLLPFVLQLRYVKQLNLI